MAQYLRQLKSGHIYIWTPDLANRKDMVPYETDKALVRIRAIKAEVERKRAILSGIASGAVEQDKTVNKIASMLNELEASSAVLDEAIKTAQGQETEGQQDIVPQQGQTEEELLAQQRKERIDADPDIQRIRAMHTKNQVEEYVLRNYGEDLDRREKLPDLKVRAEELRIARIFESDD